MRYQSYFNTALNIINAYHGEMPLAHFLKQYFALHKKHGSSDRKMITKACYAYYRLGKALQELNNAMRLKVALFLLWGHEQEWQIVFPENWLQQEYDTLAKRWKILQTAFPNLQYTAIFPLQSALSENIHSTDFSAAFLLQPKVFLRIRPGKENEIIAILQQQKVTYTQLNKTCIALEQGMKIENILPLNKNCVIQDYSSQRVGELLQCIPHDSKSLAVWDCCAASGGKSILVKDTLNAIQLTVSDIRQSILHNLQQRFAVAGIKDYDLFLADVSKPLTPALKNRYYDLIIADVPCSGSGTWSRTPEQLYFFSEQQIEEYARLQQKIVQQVIPQLKPGGFLLYITCSVFKKENEEMVQYILKNFPLSLMKQQLMEGYQMQADTMYAALLQRN
ncbi:RsmB/NOP family class I SAM-dependent RNA methyltransferase [Hydrotalea sandarakina]|jgi:16S rRNA (cytosine967-C5)-methyltransferase|uniref:16S rRNA (Cytosine967-C5)-methyltransferase n=1 Tax=Hydrotalea sandarakina TaxID=1004304 RepID=A0A2W7RXC7_9BACT|nr:Fmu (Sun) domain-containing protein [Hydrotalea sandarakina]PZX63486.1 16S rRNA (cytosine967-C5)-methyltransferase [Hydrotalea sandarakina]